jgi:predicted outer membrane repeat protein
MTILTMRGARRGVAALAASALALSGVVLAPAALAVAPGCLVSNDATHVGYRDLNAALSAAAPGATLTIKGTCVASNVSAYSNADFVIWDDVTLKGVANKVFGTPTLAGTGERSVVQVVRSAVTLIGLTITGAGGNRSTGGLFNDHGVVTIVNSTVTGNSAWTAAGIGNNGTMVLSHSTISDNTAVYGGGGIYNAGTLTMTDSVVSGNTSTLGAGGGIFNFNNCVYEGSGILTVADSTFSGNTAAQSGGAILNQGYWNTYVERSCLGAVTLTDSTISDNTANIGGGISNAGTVTIADSTVSGNTTFLVGGSGGYGGGIATVRGYMADPAVLTVTNSTISDNAAAGMGGGIVNGLGHLDGSVAVLSGSTVSGNTSPYIGGGISNWGTLAVEGSDFAANVGRFGGAIANQGALTFSSLTTTIGGNTGTGYAGGILNGGGTVVGGCPTVLGQAVPPSTTRTGFVVYDPPNIAGSDYYKDYNGFSC